jgi:hypothetical protein
LPYRVIALLNFVANLVANFVDSKTLRPCVSAGKSYSFVCPRPAAAGAPHPKAFLHSSKKTTITFDWLQSV